MGISLITAFAIQGNEIECSAVWSSQNNGKYCGWITHGNENYCRPLLNTQPIYESGKEAVVAMEGIVARIRGLDLSKQFDEVMNIATKG